MNSAIWVIFIWSGRLRLRTFRNGMVVPLDVEKSPASILEVSLRSVVDYLRVLRIDLM